MATPSADWVSRFSTASRPSSSLLWILLAMVGGLLALLMSPMGSASPIILLAIPGGLIALLLYVGYFKKTLAQPHLLLFFVLLAWPLLEFFNQWLLVHAGVNIRFRWWTGALFVMPALVLVWQHRAWLWCHVAAFRWYGFFLLWLAIYFIWNNAHAVSPERMADIRFDTLDVMFVMAYGYGFLAMVVSAVSVLKAPHFSETIWPRLNMALLIGVSLMTLPAILAYPWGGLTLQVDGVTRSIGLLTQPNPFAHRTALFLIYFIGLFAYERTRVQTATQTKIPTVLFMTAMGITGLALLLTFSKTALVTCTGCVALGGAFYLRESSARKSMAGFVAASVFLGAGLVWGFEQWTSLSLLEVLQARFDTAVSYSWRTHIWQGLLDNMTMSSLLWGHGLTAANEWVMQVTYKQIQNTKPLILIHNGYLNLVYDLGVLGLTFFVGVIAMARHAMKMLFQQITAGQRVLALTLLMLTVYFLAVSGFDEMTTMFDGSIIFWVLTTLLGCILWQQSREGVTS